MIRRLAWRSLTVVMVAPFLVDPFVFAGGTAQGEIEVRPGSVIRRSCTAGPLMGELCNSDARCDGHPCPDSDIFNLSVAVRFNATPAELQIIETSIQEAAAWLFDATRSRGRMPHAAQRCSLATATDGHTR
jgi:hypothetical protein